MASFLDQRAVKFHTMGNNMAREQKFNEAIQNFQKAIEIEPTYSAAYFHMAEVYEKKKLDDKAYENYMKAIELNNSLATSHIESGLYTLMSGPLGKAVMEYKKNMDAAAGSVPGPGAEEPQIARPAAGSPVDMATRPAVEKPRGKAGIQPLKILVHAVREDQVTIVAASEKVTAIVLGDKDIPVAKAQVSFIVLNDESMNDAFVTANPALAQAATGSKKADLVTDGDGKASIFFKRSKVVGTNKLEIRVAGLAPAFFEDATAPSNVARVDVHPKKNFFSTAQNVVFQIKAFDLHENIVPNRMLTLSLQMRSPSGTEWEVVDNQNPRTGDAGILAQEFTMPTRGHSKCRLIIEDRNASFKHEEHFTVVPGSAASLLFIPGNCDVQPGVEFPLKLRLMDEFDNPIDGISASIVLKESSGGDWTVSSQTSSNTVADGSVTISVTPPSVEGAKATFEAVSEHLPPGVNTIVRFETSEDSDSIAGNIESAVDDEFSGEFDDEPSTYSGGDTSFPADLDIGGDGLAGLPDIGADDDRTDQDLMQEQTDGGMSALDGLDYGMDDSAPAMPPAVEETPATESYSGDGGDSLSHLDSMLAGDDDYQDPYPQPEEPEYAMDTIPMPEDSAPDMDMEIAGPYTPPTSSATTSCYISLPENSITCRPGDTVPLKAVITDEMGNPVSAEISASFRLVEEIGAGGSSSMLDAYGGDAGREVTVYPDMSGEAAAGVRASTNCGTFSVEISAGYATETVTINVAPGEPESIYVSVSETEIYPGGMVTVTARISDENGNPVPGEFIAFSLEGYTGTPGIIDTPADSHSNENGEVSMMYTASQNPGDTATITASNPDVASSSVTPASISVSGGAAASFQPPAPDVYEHPDYEEPTFEQQDYGDAPVEPGSSAKDVQYQEKYGEGTYDAYPNDPVNEQYETAPPPPVSAGAPPPPPTGAGFSAPPPPPPAGGFDAPPPPPGGDITEDYEDDDYESYVSEEDSSDPYARPKFEIKQGKKAAVEVSSIMPKVVLLGVTGVLLITLAFLGIFGYKKLMYQYYYTQGVKTFTQDDRVKSMSFLEKAHMMAPVRIEPLQQLAQIRITNAEEAKKKGNDTVAEKEINQAIKYLNDILMIEPGNIDAMFELGNSFEHKQDFCSALKQFDNIIKIDAKYEAAKAKSKDNRTKCDRQQSLRKGVGRAR